MRHKEKFQIDDLYLNGYASKCGIYATGVYVSLCRHVDKEQKCWPSLNKIAKELRISPKQAGRAIKILEEFHIIKKVRVGKKLNNRYILLDRSEWTDSPITKDSQSYHLGTDSPFHSKDTQLRYTQRRKDSFKKKPFYKPTGQPMWKDRYSKWWVIRGKNDFSEFAGELEDIVWK